MRTSTTKATPPGTMKSAIQPKSTELRKPATEMLKANVTISSVKSFETTESPCDLRMNLPANQGLSQRARKGSVQILTQAVT